MSASPAASTSTLCLSPLPPHPPTALPSLRPNEDPTRNFLHSGSGFVVYPNEELAERAIAQLNNRQLYSRPLRVRPLLQSDVFGAPRPAMPPGHHGFSQPQALVPPNVRAFLDGMSPAAAHKLLTELRKQAISQPEPTRQQLLQFPVLAQAVVHLMARMGTLRSGTPAYSAAAATSASAAVAAAAQQAHLQAQQAQQAQPLSQEEREQVEQVKGFMALSEAAVAALPPDSRPAVVQLRYALNTPLEQLIQEQQTDLISLREELSKLFSRYVL